MSQPSVASGGSAAQRQRRQGAHPGGIREQERQPGHRQEEDGVPADPDRDPEQCPGQQSRPGGCGTARVTLRPQRREREVEGGQL